MWVLWLISALGLGVAVWALLRAGSHLPDPRGHRRLVLGVGAGVLALLIGPPLVRAIRDDWRTALTTIAVVLAAAAALWAYVRLIRRARAGADRGDD